MRERCAHGGVIMAELDAADLERFLSICHCERRTTGFMAGRILHLWIQQRDAATAHRQAMDVMDAIDAIEDVTSACAYDARKP